MGTILWEVVCDENTIGGGGEYFGDAQLGLINAFYHEASGGKYVTRAVLMDLEPEPSAIDAVTLSRRSKKNMRPGSLVNKNAGAGNNWAKGFYTRAGCEFC
jgi:tubulin beta